MEDLDGSLKPAWMKTKEELTTTGSQATALHIGFPEGSINRINSINTLKAEHLEDHLVLLSDPITFNELKPPRFATDDDSRSTMLLRHHASGKGSLFCIDNITVSRTKDTIIITQGTRKRGLRIDNIFGSQATKTPGYERWENPKTEFFTVKRPRRSGQNSQSSTSGTQPTESITGSGAIAGASVQMRSTFDPDDENSLEDPEGAGNLIEEEDEEETSRRKRR